MLISVKTSKRGRDLKTPSGISFVKENIGKYSRFSDNDPSYVDTSFNVLLLNRTGLIADTNGIIKYINPDFLKLIKKDSDTCKNECLFDWIHPDDVSLTIDHIVKLLRENFKSVKFHSRFKIPTGNYLELNLKALYSRELVYFSLIDVPKKVKKKKNKNGDDLMDISESQTFKESFLKDLDKTFHKWDQFVSTTLHYCTKIK